MLQAAWTSFHNNKDLSRKYMGTYHIGQIRDEERQVGNACASIKCYNYLLSFHSNLRLLKIFLNFELS